MYLFQKKPFFLFLLPVFFVFHGFTRFFPFVPIKDASLLLLFYLMIATSMTALAWIFYRNMIKASLLTIFLLGYHFFFGTIQDILKATAPGSLFSRYIFILPASLLILIIVLWWLKKKNKFSSSLVFYLNSVFLLFIAMDLAWLISKISGRKNKFTAVEQGLIPCKDCDKPDIYFIILDGYSGNEALKEAFHFNNDEFENQLVGHGFNVISRSNSNYNYTPFSLASILNMEYLDLDMEKKGGGNLNYCYRMISNSTVINFLEKNSYRFYNYSVFDFPGQLAPTDENFLPLRTKLITAQTFTNRVWKDLVQEVRSGQVVFKALQKKIVYAPLHNNEKLIRLTLETASRKTRTPKFLYTHLMLPHYPYYFDSSGHAMSFDSLVEGRQLNKHNYIGYLQYCNRKILGLTDEIIKRSPLPPVIILAGDHGFRYFIEKSQRRFCFSNLSAVLLPSHDYAGFYNELSGVNLFRVIFNSLFQQHLELKKDSTIYLWD